MTPAAPERRRRLAAVHLAKRDLALEDESYRELLERVTGKRSAAELDEAALRLVLQEFERLGWKRSKGTAPKRCGRRLDRRPQARKARALWIVLHNLGAVTSGEEAALGAFVQRQTGRAALQWCGPEELNRVVEALKAWAGRAGLQAPTTAEVATVANARRLAGLSDGRDAEGMTWRAATLKAQWETLIALGCFRHGVHADLGTWLAKRGGHRVPHFLAPQAADAAILDLGRWLRREKAKRQA